jgi:hypothetical protein
MNQRHRVRLRHRVDGSHTRVVELHETALLDELTEGDRLGPETEILVGDQWVRLADHPAPVWLNHMALRAIAAAERADPIELERYAGKVLRYSEGGPDADRHEAVRLGRFLLGHLALCAGRPRAAVDLLEPAGGRRSRFSTAALNNLGVAWARSRHPEAAWRAFETALAEDPRFLPASVSLRNLARTLIDERAPGLPGRPSWAELARREHARLHEPSVALQVGSLLDPHRPFPSHRLWHVFHQDMNCPEIGSNLVVEPLGRRAAEWLLTEGNRAWNDADDARAQVLAVAAMHFNPQLRPAAESLAAAAAPRREQARLFQQAHRFARWLGTFLRQLNELTIDNLDAAREAQAVLSAFVDSTLLEKLYRERIEELAAESAGVPPSGPALRARLWTLAHRFASSETAEACRKAALRCLAEPPLRDFWSAVLVHGDQATAVRSLGQAETILGSADDLATARALLEDLQSHQALHATAQTTPADELA